MKKTLFTLFCLLLVSCSAFFYVRLFVQPDLTIIGPINMADGLGRQSVELIDNLRKTERIHFISTKRRISYKDVPLAVQFITKMSPYFYKQWGKVILLEDQIWRPNDPLLDRIVSQITRKENHITFAYSMFESTRIPEEWVTRLNHSFDAVCIPDPFLEESYRNSGVTIPIFTLPLALNLHPFLSSPLKEKRNHPMIFANLSVCSDRKNQLKLIRAFAQAFGNDPNVALKINYRRGDKETILAIKDELAELKPTNIFFTDEVLDGQAYLAFFKNIDCYVSLSKGEGFSIQPREAMALGIPTIVTDNTGQSTICKSGFVKVIATPYQEAAFYKIGPQGFYCGDSFNCEIEEVVKALQELYENYDHYLARNKQAREWVKQYRYEELQTLYQTLVRPKEILFGSENKLTAEYLMTNSLTLYQKYKNQHSIYEKNSFPSLDCI